MPEIIDYKLVVNRDPNDLSSSVRESVKNGWVPFGSPTSYGYNHSYGHASSYSQAMVKYAKTK